MNGSAAEVGTLGTMALDPSDLPQAAVEFLTERHLATFTTLREDGSPHVVPVGFTWDGHHRLARVICSGSTVHARNAARGGRAVLCQVDGRRWLSLEGQVSLASDDGAVLEAVRRYALRYRVPGHNPERVVVSVVVDRVLGSIPQQRPS